jgi:hypothetical protein
VLISCNALLRWSDAMAKLAAIISASAPSTAV